MIIKFKQWDCVLETGIYGSGNMAIKLIGTELPVFDNLVAVVTTNLPGLSLKEVAIKDWSENEGMYQTLLDAGIIEPAHRFTQSGWIEKIPVCYLRTEL